MMAAETFQSKDEDGRRRIQWRKISRNLIIELNEKVSKRRQTLSRSEPLDDFSQHTSDEESTSVSKGLSDEYHRKKLADAELKFKMLEGLDTLSESSSLSSSMCFQELEVHDEADEKTSMTENINSHNSGGDGRSDSESVSYSTSFTGSIEEDCTSNVDSNSSYTNAITSQMLQTNVDNGSIVGDKTATSVVDLKPSEERINNQSGGLVLGKAKHAADGEIFGFQTGAENGIQSYESSNCEGDDASTHSSEKGICSGIRGDVEHNRHVVMPPGDREVNIQRAFEDPTTQFLTFLDQHGDTKQDGHAENDVTLQFIDDKEDTKDQPEDLFYDWRNGSVPIIDACLNVVSSEDGKVRAQVEVNDKREDAEPSKYKIQGKDDDFPTGSLEVERDFRSSKELDGFDDIHELFIGQMGEKTSNDYMSNLEIGEDKFTENLVCSESVDQYTPTLIHRTRKDTLQSILSETLTSLSASSSPPKGEKLFEIPFQNISCNKGTSSKECITESKTTKPISTSSTRRQTLLKDTLNRPLQFCIEKARLVTSIRESIDSSRSTKDKIAGRAAYDKAIREFAEAVDKLLADQNKEDDHSFNDNTYSLDDTKVVRKPAPNPLDALRTPVNRRRITAQQEAMKKNKTLALDCNDDLDLLGNQTSSGFEKNEDLPPMQRTTTFVVVPAKKSNLSRSTTLQKAASGKDGVKIKPKAAKENVEPATSAEMIFFEDELKKDTSNERDCENGSGIMLTYTQKSHKDNDDTAYVSDLSPPLDNDITHHGHVPDTDKGDEDCCGDKNDITFDINRADKTFALDVKDQTGGDRMRDEKDYSCQSSDDETLNIVDSFCNVDNDNESVDLNDMLPLDHDFDSKTSSRTSLDELWFDVKSQGNEIAQDHTAVYNCQDIIGPTILGKSERYFGQNEVSKLQNKLSQCDIDNKAFDQVSEGHSDQITTIETSYGMRGEKATDDTTSKTDALHSLSNEQTDEKEVFVSCQDKQPQNNQLRKLRENANGMPSMKSEVSQNESFFSSSSSTSGEYSLLNNAIQKRSIAAPYNPDTIDTVSFRDVEKLTGDTEFHRTHPPSEMLIREKSAHCLEEISVENKEIFHQLNDIPSAYVMKHPNDCNVDKRLATGRGHQEAMETFDDSFENSLNDLRKTAKGCLGPLREKVAFFENIERALQSHETQAQCFVGGENHFTVQNNLEQSLEYFKDESCIQTEDIIPVLAPVMPVQGNATVPETVQDSTVQTNGVSFPENRGTQTTSAGSVSEKGQQCNFSSDTAPALMTLVDDLKVRVSESNHMFESLQNCLEGVVLNTSLERERINSNLDALTRRIESSEAVIIDKISSVENAMLSATHETGSGFQSVKEELDKLRSVNAEHVGDLKRFSSEIAIRKKDLDVWENKITTNFEEHMSRVHGVLDILLEPKPGPSTPLKVDSDSSKQSCINDLRIRVIEMKNQRDAEKMYHKITRESLRALERDHDRLRQEVLMAATRRHLADRRKPFRLNSLAEESNITDIEVPQMTSTPRKSLDTQNKEIQNSKIDTDNDTIDHKENKTKSSINPDCDGKKERKSKK